MNINHNLFYGNLVSDEDKALVYNCLDMVALITGIVKVSGGRLAVARVAKVVSFALGERPAEDKTMGDIYMVDRTEGCLVLRLAKTLDAFIADSPHTDLLRRGRNRHSIVSKNYKRLLTTLKKHQGTSAEPLIDAVIKDARRWQMHYRINDTLRATKRYLGGETHYSGQLTGKEQFEALGVLLGGVSLSEIPLAQQKLWNDALAGWSRQRDKLKAAIAEIASIYTKSLWIFSLSEIGLSVGLVSYPVGTDGFPDLSLETRNVLIPFVLYKNIHSIPDEAIREELITTLTMARVNRDSKPKFSTNEYVVTDPDKFFPTAEHVYADSQSVSTVDFMPPRMVNGCPASQPEGAFNTVVTFVIPR